MSLRRNGQSFVAATPERLLDLRAGRLEVDAIAGTAPRAESVAGDAALRARCSARTRTCASTGWSSTPSAPPWPTAAMASGCRRRRR
jgi:hypothetical protein